MAEEKTHVSLIWTAWPYLSQAFLLQKEPIEALVRSLLLVLLDNGTAEWSFITAFFSQPSPLALALPSPLSKQNSETSSMLLSPDQMSSPTRPDFDDTKSNGSEVGWTPRARLTSITGVLGQTLPLSASIASGLSGELKEAKEELTALSTVWKQVFDPVLEYCQVCSVPWLL